MGCSPPRQYKDLRSMRAKLSPGMSMTEIRANLGEPSSTSGSDRGVGAWTYNGESGEHLIITFDDGKCVVFGIR